MKKAENFICVKGVELVFVNYGGEDRCFKCFLGDMAFSHCKKIKCTADEREDKQQGYFRALGARKINSPV